ncbi:MAG TPA: hypothetical protein VGR67_06640, partial [Candidatus Polarisedimenticolia bacterium]|nr:hypothetical protein [Candidatus Polarisedimenticolia bacterium]
MFRFRSHATCYLQPVRLKSHLFLHPGLKIQDNSLILSILMANAILRETGHAMTAEEAGRILRLHAEAYSRLSDQVRPLPGARELLAYLTRAGVPWAIATSGRMESA